MSELELLVAHCKHCGTAHGPGGLAYRSTCCREALVGDRNFSWGAEPGTLPDPEVLLTTHGLARYLLDGPDAPVRYDYGEGRAMQAEWTEATDERFRAFLHTEPDWNPPESEAEAETEPRPRGLVEHQFGPAVELAARARKTEEGE